MIIAVDGPAASGKGTIARALARHFGLPHLDTGSLYRAVALSVIREDGDPEDAREATRHAETLSSATLADPAIRSREIGAAASIVSVHSGVRQALLAYQREFAARPGGAVLDGRDIGTVIAPHADAKLFVTAATEERARRRTEELKGRGGSADEKAILADLLARDARDSGRAEAPLAVAPGAAIIDTTALGVDEAIAAAIAAVQERVPPA